MTNYWGSSLNSSLTTFPLDHCAPAILASSLFPQCSSLDVCLFDLLPYFVSVCAEMLPTSESFSVLSI